MYHDLLDAKTILSLVGHFYRVPRLSSKEYLRCYQQLRYVWLRSPSLFSYLRPDQQRQLHAFFRPADDLTAEQLRQHRKDITATQPALPHQAGHALQLLRNAIASTKAKPRSRSAATKSRDLGVRAIVRPSIDPDKLAKALWEMAEEIVAARKRPSKPKKDQPQDQDGNKQSVVVVCAKARCQRLLAGIY